MTTPWEEQFVVLVYEPDDVIGDLGIKIDPDTSFYGPYNEGEAEAVASDIERGPHGLKAQLLRLSKWEPKA